MQCSTELAAAVLFWDVCIKMSRHLTLDWFHFVKWHLINGFGFLSSVIHKTNPGPAGYANISKTITSLPPHSSCSTFPGSQLHTIRPKVTVSESSNMIYYKYASKHIREKERERERCWCLLWGQINSSLTAAQRYWFLNILRLQNILFWVLQLFVFLAGTRTSLGGLCRLY